MNVTPLPRSLDGVADGIVAVVKRECPTCTLVAPVLAELVEREVVRLVFSQDDPSFPDDAPWVVDDTDLEVSFSLGIDTVPALLRIERGAVVARTVGWSKSEWAALTRQPDLGFGLPEHRPGCGSLSVDPTRVDTLEARFGPRQIHSRRIDIAELEDEFEAIFARGWTDGLPVIPPTEARVARMLRGTVRDPREVVAVVPPDLVECTVEKVAINAVLAGCRPEYLPVVLAAVEAACSDEYNMHGVLATTMPVGPVIVVNGPIARSIGMNSGINVLGQGNRANLSIGRALQLTVRNVGGGRPGEVDRATQGNPGKLSFCFAEDEAGSPWESLAVERGFGPGTSTVTLFTGEGPRVVADQKSRSPEALTRSLAAALRTTISVKMAAGMDAMLVLSPEHAARYRDAGWTKARFRQELDGLLLLDGDELVEGALGIADGLPTAFAGQKLPKFTPTGLLIVHAGGPAGLFSSIIGGWANGPKGSQPVTKEIAS